MIPRGVMLSVIAVVVLAGLANAPRRTLVCYDEGVYFYQSVLWVEGQRPYRDFFVPQPPGVLLMGAASELVGLGLTGCRLVAWACGVGLLVQTFRLGRRLAVEADVSDPTTVGIAAALFVAVAHSFIYGFTEGATTTPAAVLCLWAVELALSRKALAAGAVLGLATLIRLQPMTVVPAVAVLLLVRDGVKPAILHSVAFAVVAGLIHGGLSAALLGYSDDVFGFQADRPRSDMGVRLGMAASVAAQPQVGLGLLAVAAALGSARPMMRGIAAAAAVLLVATTFAGSAVYFVYYLPALPLLSAVGATMIGTTVGKPGVAWPAVTVAVMAAGGLIATDRLAQQRRDIPPTADYLDRIAKMPGATVLTDDPLAAVWAGKRGVPDYYASDPNALYQLSPDRLGEWVAKVLPLTDAVAVSERFAEWLPSSAVRTIRASGKPLAFESPKAEATFTQKQEP